MDLKDFGEPIPMEDATPKTQEINYVFPDSKFLPIEGIYEGDIERPSKSGEMIPYRVFNVDGKPYIASRWNKAVNIPVPLKKGKMCKLYNEKRNDKVLCILQLEE